MNIISLNGQWTCSGTDTTGNPLNFKLTIPGTVHTGMLENNLLPDIFYGENANECMWIEEKNWTFTKEFDFSLNEETKKAELEFSGLDTYCNIFLNDEKIAFCDNANISYTFDILPFLRNGKNIIRIEFLPPSEQVKDVNYGICNGAFSQDRIFTRRMQCSYGWDWVHRLVTMGIWRDVTLYINRFVKIDSLKATLKNLTDFGADMEISITGTHAHEFFHDAFGENFPHSASSPMVQFKVEAPDGTTIYKNKRLFRESLTLEYFTVSNPKLWFPNGYGDSSLYKLYTTIFDADNNILCEKCINFGIRSVSIIEKHDEIGSHTREIAEKKFSEFIKKEPQDNEFSSFEVIINNKKIYCKGGNFVPPNPFPGNVSYEKTEELIRLAHDAGINMLRVWGGGYFGTDDFYNLCDKYGILVQQDFLMACGTYPYDNAFLDEHDEDYLHFTESFRAECEQNVARIASHPSLIWYNGDNENMMGNNENFVSNARRLAYGVTLPAIRKYDTERRFFPSSPWGGSHFNSPAKGMFHATGFLDFYLAYIKNESMDDYVSYFGNAISRFGNETPVMSSVSLCSLKKFIPENELSIGSFSHLDFHTKNHPAKEYKDFHLFDHINLAAKKIFGEFKSAEDRLYKMNILGYEWIRSCMESYRRNSDYTSGNLFWMYNDCWPAVGWSMVDYYLVPKTAYYAMKKTSKSVISSIVNEDGKIRVYISNAGLTDEQINGKLYLVTQDEIKKCIPFEFLSEKGTSEIAFECDSNEFKTNENTIIVCDTPLDRSFYSSLKPSKLNFAKPEISITKKEKKIILKTDKAGLFVTLDGEFVFSENCLLLLPGEEKTIFCTKSFDSESDEIKIFTL